MIKATQDMKSIHEEISIDLKQFEVKRLSGTRREQAIKEALSWPKGPDTEHKTVTCLYSIENYTIGISKPGKEAAPDYKRCRNRNGEYTNNPNDMLPTILIDGNKREGNLSFTDIFECIHELSRKDEFGLELLGTVLFRAAFMLDHLESKPGIWRFCPPEKIMKEIETRIPTAADMPIRVFLHLVEVLSLNEDVKYGTLGYDTIWAEYGRRNNLLTCAHLIAVLLNRASLIKFAGSLTRPPVGVAPLSYKKGLEVFNLLVPEVSVSSE
jgi:hypothetical protein